MSLSHLFTPSPLHLITHPSAYPQTPLWYNSGEVRDPDHAHILQYGKVTAAHHDSIAAERPALSSRFNCRVLTCGLHRATELAYLDRAGIMCTAGRRGDWTLLAGLCRRHGTGRPAGGNGRHRAQLVQRYLELSQTVVNAAANAATKQARKVA